MADSVTRRRFDREHDARVKAELMVTVLTEQLNLAHENETRLISQLQDNDRRHHESMQALITHAMPVTGTVPPADAVQVEYMTAEEIERLPAVGLREMKLRASAAKRAREREAQTEQERRVASRPDVERPVSKPLTDSDRGFIDSVLGATPSSPQDTTH